MDWLERLPRLVAELVAEWSLELELPFEPATKPMKAANITRPAAVTIRPVFASPAETASSFVCPSSHSSRMRLTRKTS